jgi:uncharacterized lipoprotein YmbA
MKRMLLLMLVLAAACLGPRPDLSAFFLLSPAPAPTGTVPAPVSLGVGPVTLPGYLDRPELVVRVNENEIALSTTDRWAEPLAENLVRTLEDNLSALLPGSTYVDYPWFESRAPEYAVSLDVRRFEADATGAVVLDAAWRVGRGDSQVGGGQERIEEVASGPDRAAAVAAQSRALAELSRRIAASVRGAAGR